MQQKIAVVGGGLVGRLLALQLAKLDYALTLYEKDAANGDGAAAYVAAAMLAPLAESVDATALVTQLGYQSIDLWRDILTQLDTPVYMQQAGSLIVWHPQDQALADNFQQHLLQAHQQQQLWQDWDSQQIQQQEPQLAGRFQQALYLPQEGQLDNRQVLQALADQLPQLGVQCHWHTSVEPQQLIGHFDLILDCRGVGAKNDWQQNNCGLAAEQHSYLRAVRGEVLRVYAPEVSLRRPVRMLHPRYPLYVAPKQQHIFVVGATQLESEDDSNVSVRSGLELLSALYAIHPAFGEARIEQLLTGLRPTLQHHEPVIRYSKIHGLIQVNGLFRHGFMIAPAVVDATVRLIQQLQQPQQVADIDAVTGMQWQRMFS